MALAIETAAGAATGTSVDVEQWAKRIDTSFRTGGFIPYSKARDWAAGIMEVLDSLTDLLGSGYAADVVGLAERAHRKLERTMRRVDDSGGEVVLLSADIADLHRQAAVAASPEPVAFARRLAKLELESELDTFRRAALAYVDVLGEKGLREYRKAVEPRWRKANQGPADQWSHDRFVATEAMIGVALAGGQPDELVEIMSDRLRTPDDYLEVARAMEGADRRGEAIRWSRRGLTSMGNRFWPTQALREFLASLYVADGDDEAAEDLWWEDFRARPSVETYRRLIAESRSCDPAEAADRAIGELRARTDPAAGDSSATAPASVQVHVLLYEGRVDDAWLVATRQGVDEQTWMKLAPAREPEHPLEAIPIYARARRGWSRNEEGRRLPGRRKGPEEDREASDVRRRPAAVPGCARSCSRRARSQANLHAAAAPGRLGLSSLIFVPSPSHGSGPCQVATSGVACYQALVGERRGLAGRLEVIPRS